MYADVELDCLSVIYRFKAREPCTVDCSMEFESLEHPISHFISKHALQQQISAAAGYHAMPAALLLHFRVLRDCRFQQKNLEIEFCSIAAKRRE